MDDETLQVRIQQCTNIYENTCYSRSHWPHKQWTEMQMTPKNWTQFAVVKKEI